MLIPTQVVYGSAVEASDGPVGSVQDLYYRSEDWRIRYLTVDVGGWLEDRQILVVPRLLTRRDWATRRLELPVDREQVRHSRPLESGSAGPIADPAEVNGSGLYSRAISAGNGFPHDPLLHGARHTIGFRVEALDGPIGVVKELLVDDEPWDRHAWELRHLVVDARHLLPGRYVVLALQWADQFTAEAKRIRVSLRRDTIAHSPHFDPTAPISRSYEDLLYDYYRMPKYWSEHPV